MAVLAGMGLVLVSSIGTLVAGQAVPAWCQYVPASFQGVACRGSSTGCSCESFCNEQKDANNPECCGCGDAGAGAQQSAGATPVSQMYMLRGSSANLLQRQNGTESGTISAPPSSEIEALAAWRASAVHAEGPTGGATAVHASGGSQAQWHHGSATVVHAGGSGSATVVHAGGSGGSATYTSGSSSSSGGDSTSGDSTDGGSSATYSSGSSAGATYSGSSGATVVHTGGTVVQPGGATVVHHGGAAGGVTAAHHSGAHGSATVVHRR